MKMIPCKPNSKGIEACFIVVLHSIVHTWLCKSMFVDFFSETNITAVFQEAVSLFNEAGCVKWVPRTSEEDYISVIGNQLK